MIWVIGAFAVTFGWPLLGFFVVDLVDDEQHRLGNWMVGPEDNCFVAFVIPYFWPLWVWKWVKQGKENPMK